MASYEWVIEQETPDGLTTRIVFDFADDDAVERYGGRSRASGNAAHYHLHPRRDSRGRGGNAGVVHGGSGNGSAGAGSSGSVSGATAANGTGTFFFLKDATRSEGGGSSRRSSKHSNGSRSRRHGHPHPHHRTHHGVGSASGSNGNNSGGGASVNGGGAAAGRMLAMAAPTGSAYTSAALRQRYQRMLGGGGRGTVATSVASRGGSRTQTSITPSSTSARLGARPFESAVNGDDIGEPSAPLNTGHEASAMEVPPSTLFMSAYGAEVVDEDESPSSTSSPAYPARLSHGSTGSSGHSSSLGGGAVKVGHAAGSRTWWTPNGGGGGGASDLARTAATDDDDHGEPPQHHEMACSGAGEGAVAPRLGEPLTRPGNRAATLRRRGQRRSGDVGGGAHVRAELRDEDADNDDADEDDSVYDGRGVHDGPRACGQSGIHDGGHGGSYYVLRDVWAARAACPRTIASTRAADFPAFPPLHPISVDDDDDVDDDERPPHTSASTNAARNGNNASSAPAASKVARDVFGGTEGITLPCTPTTDAWTAESPVSPFLTSSGSNVFGFQTSPTDSPLEHRQYNKMLLKKERQRRRGRGWQPILASTAPNTTTMAASPPPRRDARQARRPNTRAAAPPARASTSASDSTDADDESGGEDEDGDDTSSLECLSATSSDDADGDARGLCADAQFAATVQSLASRAGRARRKMEAQEGAEEDEEAARRARAMTSRGGVEASASGTGEASGPTLASALRRGGGGGGGSNGTAAPSSFFISPIHQSVAAESAGWAAGTGLQFLGHGGLGHDARGATARAAPASSSLAERRRAGTAHRLRRRRRREEDDEEADDVVEAHARAASQPQKPPSSASAASQRSSRKRRKTGDAVQQSVVGECGGSRALRPVAAPSNGPPLEILPSSKSDMREDLLESFLMEAVLDEDDFHLF